MATDLAAQPIAVPRHRASAAIRLVLAGLPLSTGAALIAYIVFHIPMAAAAAAFAIAGIAAWVLVLPSLEPATRRQIGRRAALGALAGVPAIAAYDGTRFGVVALASMSFQPFHVFPLFGYALLGTGASALAATLAGIGFHIANGLGFAIAFSLAISRPNPLLGIAWALCLEALMLLLYPGWLGISLASELVPISFAGHLAYGSVLGHSLSRFTR